LETGYRTWVYARRVIGWTLEAAIESQGVLVRLRRTRRRRQDALTLGMKVVQQLLSPNASNQDPEHRRSLHANLYSLQLDMDVTLNEMDHAQEVAFLWTATQPGAD